MAFPSVRSAVNTNGPTATTTPSIALPATISAGDTILVVFRSTVSGAISWPAGWTELLDNSADLADDQTAAAWKKADGSEGGTNISLSSGSGRFAAVAYAIRDAADPTAFPPEVSSPATGSGIAPNPGSLTPTGGVQDYLWLVAVTMEGESAVSAWPTNYSSNQVSANSGTAGGSAGNCTVFAAVRTANAASEDPGAFTVGPSDDWQGLTFAFYPVPAGAGARSFDGVDDTLTAAAVPSSSTGDLTLLIWYYRPSGSSNFVSAFCVGGHEGTNFCLLNIGSSNWGAFVGGSSSANFETGVAPDVDAWRCVALRVSSGLCEIVHHGSIAATTGTVTGRNAPSARTTIGGRSNTDGTGFSQAWPGRLAHAAIWERALSDSELSDMATNRKSPLFYPTNLVAYWPITGSFSPEPDEVGSVDLTLTGAIQIAGPGITYPKSLSGSLTPTGALSLLRQLSRAFSGSVTPSGALRNQARKLWTGSLGSTGTLVRSIAKRLTGVLTPSGALEVGNTLIQIVLSGVLTPAGSLTRRTSKGLVGALTPGGGLAKLVAKRWTGSLGSAGLLRKLPNKMLGGSVGSSGALSTTRAFLRVFSGSITPAGTLVKGASLFFGGSVGPAGVLRKTIAKPLSGAIALAGILRNHTQKLLTGTVTPTGLLRTGRLFIRLFTGSIAATGSLVVAVFEIGVASTIGRLAAGLRSATVRITGRNRRVQGPGPKSLS